jgi:exonuclease SbcC
MIGCGKLQEMSEAAGAHAKKIDDKITKLRARKEALEATENNAAALREDLERAQAEETTAIDALTKAEEAAEKSRALEKEWSAERNALSQALTEARAEQAAARSSRDAINDAQIRLSDKETALRAKHAGLTARLGQREALEKEAAAGDESDERVKFVEHELSKLRTEQQQHTKDLTAWSAERDALQRAADDADRQHAAAAKEAEAALETAEKERTRALEQATRDIDQKVLAASGHLKRARDEEERSTRAAARIDSVPCGGAGEYGACPLISDAAAEAAELEGRVTAVKDAEAALNQLRGAKPEDDPAVTAANSGVAVKGKELDAVHSDDAAVRQAHKAFEEHPPAPTAPAPTDALEDRLAALRRSAAAATEARAKLEAMQEISKQADDLQAELADLVDEIDRGIDRLTAAGTCAEEAAEKARLAAEAADAHGVRAPGRPDPDILSSARDAQTTAVAVVAAIKARLEAAEEAAADLAIVRSAITDEMAELDDWTHLQKAFGRSGIQALEIDCAGPEVSGLINDLIHSGYGSRFTCELRTTALKASGDGTKEIFDLNVIDTERGTDGSVDDLSGGEETIVGEAISIAIAIYNTRRSSIPMLDLFRDECSGALSAGHAVKYIRMLRRALDLGGFTRCYFVAHQPPLWRLADERILFDEDGCKLTDDIPDEATAA